MIRCILFNTTGGLFGCGGNKYNQLGLAKCQGLKDFTKIPFDHEVILQFKPNRFKNTKSARN
jgi:hypothetical protein